MKLNALLSTSVFTLVASLSLVTGCTITTEPAGSSSGTLPNDAVLPATSSSSSGGAASGCGFGEPNNTRDAVTQVSLGTAYEGICLSGRDDQDWFQFTAPNDAAGGYVKVELTNVRDTSIAVKAYAQATNREVLSTYSATEGESVLAYFTVAPGEKYNVVVEEFTGRDVAMFDMKVVYVAFDDAYEANQTRDAAKNIAAGATVSALLVPIAGPADATDADVDDWYKVELPAGKASVALENIPTNMTVSYEMVSAGGTVIDSGYKATEGESLLRDAIEVPAAGTYFVRVGTFLHVTDNAGKGALPDNFSRKYTLVVASL